MCQELRSITDCSIEGTASSCTGGIPRKHQCALVHASCLNTIRRRMTRNSIHALARNITLSRGNYTVPTARPFGAVSQPWLIPPHGSAIYSPNNSLMSYDRDTDVKARYLNCILERRGKRSFDRSRKKEAGLFGNT